MFVHERQRGSASCARSGDVGVIIRQFWRKGYRRVTAWLVALPISYYLSRLLLSSVPFNEVIRFEYTPLAPVVGLVGVLIITTLATIYPGIRASQKTVAEILRYQ